MIRGIYFSATGTTKTVVEMLCSTFSRYRDNEETQIYDFTLPEARLKLTSFFESIGHTAQESDVLFIGVPVYAGRVPNVLLKSLNALQVIPEYKRAYAVPVVVYGNRHYDSALNELGLILQEKGFSLLGAAAFVGEHAFSNKLAKGRPDERDFRVIEQFAEALQKTQYIQMEIEDEKQDHVFFNQKLLDQLGGAHTRDALKPYYRPQNANGDLFDFRPIKPMTTDACTDCGICSDVCPMGSIDKDNPKVITGICIKCCACIKRCPVHAKAFTDMQFIFHKTDLENTWVVPKVPSLFFNEER
ncbi:EFR1 family ferrodoxin [Fusibacter ferrireducens]|uniref:EFR1 family ferrodoxin n=1 Tax=Fusibacter ferrireducens TaxID=2785058 RepID=A0ABR9ZZ88_9FIRM|nr:EFR1 family ferrodoxin [Fusibacter ferrireducens]MBF4695771.1 EFR1 family ferrodoxin [Fusibacter ferrireducens]